MKKTLIALAVAASAAVSGSAMAWTANGTGGSVDLGGTLTPTDVITPWEVKIGAAATGLDGVIKKGQKVVNIAVNKPIPVLGIRTVNAKAFQGQAGIAPQIDYQGAIDINKFANNVATLTIDVQSSDNSEKIGSLSAPLLALGEYSVNGPRAHHRYNLIAGNEGQGFFGGLPKGESGSTSGNDISDIDPEFKAKYDMQGREWKGYGANNFGDTEHTYSAYYGSGIKSGQTIKLTLDQNASGDAPIQWKASLPVTVSYQ
ncbi:TPA: hypothetical protein JLE90_004929 [Escherichia coli]|nr:hypothetical protein [Escherichia coli]